MYGRTAVWREKRRGLFKPLPIPDRIWVEISIDFITGLPPLEPDRVTNIIVITDRLFKDIIFEAIVSTTSEAVVDRLLYYLIRYYGIPTAIVSDRGP